MSPDLLHESTRVPITALASCGSFLVAAEGPFLRVFATKDSRYILSKRVFKAQSVHGISVLSSNDNVTRLVIWGGHLVCGVHIRRPAPNTRPDEFSLCVSNVAKAPDWILDLAPSPTLRNDGQDSKILCAAVTAHNALLQVTIDFSTASSGSQTLMAALVTELTTSSRSILYSAHLLWESSTRILVAAGTAFGEIMYWSWTQDPSGSSECRIHRIFLGHEGSIFGVRISQNLSIESDRDLKRVVASCSDDRTIRIWDVSTVKLDATSTTHADRDLETLRTRHTGFSNESFDASSFSSSDCLAVGWGHTSRVWSVQFLDCPSRIDSLFLLSGGEDATSRTWQLSPSKPNTSHFTYNLTQLECTAHHSGKNLWSVVVHNDTESIRDVVCGGADSKIVSYPLRYPLDSSKRGPDQEPLEYAIRDVIPSEGSSESSSGVTHQSSKKGEFVRSYCFIDESTFLLTTNSGKVVLGSLTYDHESGQPCTLEKTTLVAQPEELLGYSVCTSGAVLGTTFVAGPQGSIHAFNSESRTFTKIHSVHGKIGELFAAPVTSIRNDKTLALIVSMAGKRQAQLLYVTCHVEAQVSEVLSVAFLEDSLITSMTHVGSSDADWIFLGYRRGAITLQKAHGDAMQPGSTVLSHVFENVHGSETVTCLQWVPIETASSKGHLLSVGRNGHLVVHYIDLVAVEYLKVHDLPLAMGANVEGLYMHEDQLFVHGFSSKKWVLHNVTAEEEIMSVELGGAHRSWAFQQCKTSVGGSLVWNRAASMHIYSQKGPNHQVVRSGGHGREIKAVAITHNASGSASKRFIATGSEDTDIKIFRYYNGDFVCTRTIRKHTTGIQHLQWSDDGDYLFSSGGCEEFYVWRIRDLPSSLDVGVVCEYTYIPESEHADLRIMSFDVRRNESSYVIALVFSDSSIKVYNYNVHSSPRWTPMAKGTYFTSCLTQCLFTNSQNVLTIGTDGHAVVWPLSPECQDSTVGTLKWEHPLTIHQNSSKTLASCNMTANAMLLVSGGDDGSLAIMLANTGVHEVQSRFLTAPTIVSRTHGSAVTSCAIVERKGTAFVLTSGNDEWIRLWEITLEQKGDTELDDTSGSERSELLINRHKKMKTNVSDVSSMAVIANDDEKGEAMVLLCGVGMEVIRVSWEVNPPHEFN